MATPDSGDNEVCDIINCVAIYYEKGASGNAFLRKEKFRAQISRKVRSLKALKETVRHVYFLNSPFIVIHVYSRCVSGESGLIWHDLHALCAML